MQVVRLSFYVSRNLEIHTGGPWEIVPVTEKENGRLYGGDRTGIEDSRYVKDCSEVKR